MLATNITKVGTNQAIPSDERGKCFNNELMLSGNILTLFKLSHKLKQTVTSNVLLYVNFIDGSFFVRIAIKQAQ
ncbi:hypothetical protein NTHiID18_11490 [Haemophilus influenzae]|nr:hypothetical protein CHBNIII2_07670 [Haemophilus influenzae]GBK89432.1 hypothetical protein NTHiID18_11490 [Haemophilus influenzae]